MKRTYIYLSLFIISNTFGLLNGQDSIILKTGHYISADIIQMDYQNIYYKPGDEKKGAIQIINLDKVSEVLFESYPKSKLDSLMYVAKIRNDSATVNTITPSDSTKKETPFAISFSIFPILDISGEVDIGKNFNMELGIGIGYLYTGLRIHSKKANPNKFFYLGMYLYRFKFISDPSVAVYIPVGYNRRSDSGFNFKVEFGVLIGDDYILPMPKLGFGVRF